jgi:hypothetical protein|tara:strand:+ start:1024 stop:1359 length:336 start_codon:yes stop_codon:yes gene_type:complete
MLDVIKNNSFSIASHINVSDRFNELKSLYIDNECKEDVSAIFMNTNDVFHSMMKYTHPYLCEFKACFRYLNESEDRISKSIHQESIRLFIDGYHQGRYKLKSLSWYLKNNL